MISLRLPILSILLAFAIEPALADVVLPSIISDHMVLQKTPKARIWGKADPGEGVSVTLDKLAGKATAGPDGKWSLELNLSESNSGPFEMVVQGKNRIAIADVVVGEVWVASGQSNMEFCLDHGWSRAIGAPEEIAASANPMLRQFLVQKATSVEPLDQCQGQWTVAGPATSGNFTAVGYYFGKRLQNELKIPIGILNTSWGGTLVEAWTSVGAIDTVPELKAAKEQQVKDFSDYPAKRAAYVSGFGKWLADNACEDRPPQDAAAYAGTAIATEGWTKVTLPGVVTVPGVSARGIFWLRKEITIGAKQANLPLRVNLGRMEGFEGFYWNGQLVKETTFKDLQGPNINRCYDRSAELVKEGTVVLAVRVYAPVTAPKFFDGLKVGDLAINGDWLAKAESQFAPVDAQQVAAAPVIPARQVAKQDLPGALFNAMVNPIVPYAIRGVIWYQGEQNAPRAWQYRTAFPLMIQDWRSQWKQGDFPFYFCQLANYAPKLSLPREHGWAELREAQSMALKLPHTGQAVLIDVGEVDLHPRNKKDVGERLAAIALAKDYGKNNPYESPLYESMKTENGKIRLTFAHVEGGLVARPLPATYVVKSSQHETAPLMRNSPNSELEGFAICGKEKQWVWADAKIDGDTVVVWSDKVPAPVAVRYGWAVNPTCNLYNQAKLPASPFRTDDFPATTVNVKY